LSNFKPWHFFFGQEKAPSKAFSINTSKTEFYFPPVPSFHSMASSVQHDGAISATVSFLEEILRQKLIFKNLVRNLGFLIILLIVYY